MVTAPTKGMSAKRGRRWTLRLEEVSERFRIEAEAGGTYEGKESRATSICFIFININFKQFCANSIHNFEEKKFKKLFSDLFSLADRIIPRIMLTKSSLVFSHTDRTWLSHI
jgi:hypothetical protein